MRKNRVSTANAAFAAFFLAAAPLAVASGPNDTPQNQTEPQTKNFRVTKGTQAHLGPLAKLFPGWVANDKTVIVLSAGDFEAPRFVTADNTKYILKTLSGIDFEQHPDLNILAHSLTHTFNGHNFAMTQPLHHAGHKLCFINIPRLKTMEEELSELTAIPAEFIERIPGNRLSWELAIYSRAAAACDDDVHYGPRIFADRLGDGRSADQIMISYLPQDIQTLQTIEPEEELTDIAREFVMTRALQTVHSGRYGQKNWSAASLILSGETLPPHFQDSTFIDRATTELLLKLQIAVARQDHSYKSLKNCRPHKFQYGLAAYQDMACGAQIKTWLRFDTETYILFARAALSLYNAPETSDFERRFLKLYLEAVQTFMPSIAAKANIRLTALPEANRAAAMPQTPQ